MAHSIVAFVTFSNFTSIPWQDKRKQVFCTLTNIYPFAIHFAFNFEVADFMNKISQNKNLLLQKFHKIECATNKRKKKM